MSRKPSSKKVVYAALAGNFAIAVTKFCAAAFTGSSAMLSEGVHSLVDSINELLLLHGMSRAGKPPDANHPFGYGRELYFWSFIVALLVLALGAGVSIYEGVSHMLSPEPIEKPIVNYLVLAASFAFEGTTWWIALKTFRDGKGTQGYFEAFRSSKDASTFTVLLEDSAALVGLLIALLGLVAAQMLSMPQLDGAASIGIGLVLVVSSVLLARETKSLLIGEAAFPLVRRSILQIAAADPSIRTANGVLTTQMGPHQVVVALSAEFYDALTTTQIEDCVNRVETAIKAAHPAVSVLFVKPQTADTWRQRIAGLDTTADD